MVDDRRPEDERQRPQPESALSELWKPVPREQPADPHHEKENGTAARPAEMRLPPVVEHLREVPADDGRKRRNEEQHIGDLFGLSKREKDKNEDPPDLEEGKLLRLLTEAVTIGVLDRLNEQPRPREKAEQHDGDIEIPMVAYRMQRMRKAADVVEADKVVDERHPVHRIHIDVPRHTDERGKQHAAQDMHAEQKLQLTRKQQVEKDNAAGEDNADRPLRHDSKSAAKVHQPVLPMNEQEECRRHEEEQRCIRDGCLPHIHKEDARPRDHARPESRTRTENTRRRQCGQKNGTDRHKRCRQACRKLAESAEQLERRHDQPVEDGRLVVPELIVDTRRKIVAEADHLLRRLRIDRLIGIEQSQSADAVKDLKRDHREQDEIDRPRKIFLIVHADMPPLHFNPLHCTIGICFLKSFDAPAPAISANCTQSMRSVCRTSDVK